MIGLLLLAAPLCASALIWFWVGAMNLLQSPGRTLWLIGVSTVLVTTILMAIEASSVGMGSADDRAKRGKVSTGPVGWLLCGLVIWIIAYPAYLFARRHYGRANYGWIGLLGAIVFLFSFFGMNYAIDERVRELQSIFNK